MMNDLIKALKAISDGYEIHVYPTHTRRFIQIDNPDFQPDNGSNPYLVIDIDEIESKWKEIQ